VGKAAGVEFDLRNFGSILGQERFQHLPKTKEDSLFQLLDHHGLRNTACRRDILEVFLDHNFAITHGFLEKAFHDQYDRVTIYRTLKTFVDKGLIHRIADESGELRYGRCSEECGDHHHRDNHLHFKCERCGKTFCLETGLPSKLNIPDGFIANDVQVLIVGICKMCRDEVSN
jgi:Fur family transcriptional regulator, ferric uptake regulator